MASNNQSVTENKINSVNTDAASFKTQLIKKKKESGDLGAE
jgi:hypothetical protein